MPGSLTVTTTSLFTGAVTNSALNASQLVSTDASKVLTSVSDLSAWVAGTSNQITSTNSSGVVTLSIPSAFTAPGSITSTTTLTATTTFTATTTSFLKGNVAVGASITTATGPLTVSQNTHATPLAYAGSTPTAQLIGANSTTNVMTMDAFTSTSYLIFRSAEGTSASKTATLANRTLGEIGCAGYQTTTSAFTTGSSPSISFLAAENYTGSAQGTYMTFSTTLIGSTSRSERMRILDTGCIIVGGTSGTQTLTVTGTFSVSSTSLLTGAVTNSALTASRLMSTNASKVLTSVSDLSVWVAGTSNQITSTNSSGVVTLSIPSAFTAPGSITSTTTLTATTTSFLKGNVAVGANITTATGPLTVSQNTQAAPLAFASATPTCQLIGANSAIATCVIDAFAATSHVILRRANGTSASKTASAADDVIGQLSGAGYQTTSSAFVTTFSPAIKFFASQSFTSSNQGTYMTFSTTSNNSTTLTECMRIDNGGNVGINTGSSISAKFQVTMATSAIGIYTAGSNTFSSSLSSNALKIGSTFIPSATSVGFYVCDISPSLIPTSAGTSGDYMVAMMCDPYVSTANLANGNTIDSLACYRSLPTIQNTHSSGTVIISSLYGYRSSSPTISSSSTTTVTNSYGLYIESPGSSGSGVTFTVTYAAYLFKGNGSTNYGIRMDDNSGDFALYDSNGYSYRNWNAVGTCTWLNYVASASGTTVNFYKARGGSFDGSASSDNDSIWTQNMYIRNSGNSDVLSGQFYHSATSVTASSESSILTYGSVVSGTYAERFRSHSNGYFGINNSGPAYQLDVVGDINSSTTVRAGGVALTSDMRIKTNIKEYQNGLNEIMKIRSVSYEYNGLYGSDSKNCRKVGVIAQEIKEVLPESVEIRAHGGLEDFHFYDSSAVLYASVNAIQQLKHELDVKNEQIELIQKQLVEQQKQMDELRNLFKFTHQSSND
jgi:hypothetical protein